MLHTSSYSPQHRSYSNLTLSFRSYSYIRFSFIAADRPSIVRPPATSSVALGSRIELTCGVDGNPLPQITWLLNTRPIPNAQQASYVITVASAADAGVYTCMASNRIGTASHSATLTVLCKED